MSINYSNKTYLQDTFERIKNYVLISGHPAFTNFNLFQHDFVYYIFFFVVQSRKKTYSYIHDAFYFGLGYISPHSTII